MKGGHLSIKIAAVVSSLLLAGTYIAYQAGYVPLPFLNAEPADQQLNLISSSKSGRIAGRSDASGPAGQIFMVTSKSGPVGQKGVTGLESSPVLAEILRTHPGDPEDLELRLMSERQLLMPTSKSGAILPRSSTPFILPEAMLSLLPARISRGSTYRFGTWPQPVFKEGEPSLAWSRYSASPSAEPIVPLTNQLNLKLEANAQSVLSSSTNGHLEPGWTSLPLLGEVLKQPLHGDGYQQQLEEDRRYQLLMSSSKAGPVSPRFGGSFLFRHGMFNNPETTPLNGTIVNASDLAALSAEIAAMHPLLSTFDVRSSSEPTIAHFAAPTLMGVSQWPATVARSIARPEVDASPPQKMLMNSSKSWTGVTTVQAGPLAPSQQMLMAGSKSLVLSAAPAPVASAVPPGTLLSGSKSGIVLTPEQIEKIKQGYVGASAVTIGPGAGTLVATTSPATQPAPATTQPSPNK